MDKEKLSPYLILRRIGDMSAMGAMKKFSKLGYELYGTPERIPERRGESTDSWCFIMELKNKVHDNVVEVADAPEERANELLRSGEGWKVASTSVSSKFYRMVKIVEPTKEQPTDTIVPE